MTAKQSSRQKLLLLVRRRKANRFITKREKQAYLALEVMVGTPASCQSECSSFFHYPDCGRAEQAAACTEALAALNAGRTDEDD